jgi:hypothetical protein
MGAKSQSKKRVARMKTIRCKGLLVSLVQDGVGKFAQTFQDVFVSGKADGCDLPVGQKRVFGLTPTLN